VLIHRHSVGPSPIWLLSKGPFYARPPLGADWPSSLLDMAGGIAQSASHRVQLDDPLRAGATSPLTPP
jgi:hypothetical protein